MDKLVWWTMLGVVCGIALGGGLYTIDPSDRAVELIGRPARALDSCVELTNSYEFVDYQQVTILCH